MRWFQPLTYRDISTRRERESAGCALGDMLCPEKGPPIGSGIGRKAEMNRSAEPAEPGCGPESLRGHPPAGALSVNTDVAKLIEIVERATGAHNDPWTTDLPTTVMGREVSSRRAGPTPLSKKPLRENNAAIHNVGGKFRGFVQERCARPGRCCPPFGNSSVGLPPR